METKEILYRKEDISNRDFNELKIKVDEIFYALVGNNLTKDQGMIGQINALKTEMKRVENYFISENEERKKENEERKKENQELKDKNIKMEAYKAMAFIAGGFIIEAIYGIFLAWVNKK